MLAVLLLGTQLILLLGSPTMDKPTTQIRDHCRENGKGKITNLHYTVFFRSNPTKNGEKKEWKKIGYRRNMRDAKHLSTHFQGELTETGNFSYRD